VATPAKPSAKSTDKSQVKAVVSTPKATQSKGLLNAKASPPKVDKLVKDKIIIAVSNVTKAANKAPAPEPAAKTEVRANHDLSHLELASKGITDPCAGITCAANLKCPAGFSVTEVAGHCCAYCVNPNIKLEAAIPGATGSNGGKASTFCPKVWCFPTACQKSMTNPTTTNGLCCATCPA